MFRLVTTMGIVQVEQNRLRQQEIEVRALVDGPPFVIRLAADAQAFAGQGDIAQPPGFVEPIESLANLLFFGKLHLG